MINEGIWEDNEKLAVSMAKVGAVAVLWYPDVILRATSMVFM